MPSLLFVIILLNFSSPTGQAFQFPARLPSVVQSFFLRNRRWGTTDEEKTLGSSSSSSSSPLFRPQSTASTSKSRNNQEQLRPTLWPNTLLEKEKGKQSFTSTTSSSFKHRKWKGPKMRRRPKKSRTPRPPVETGKVCRVVTLSDGMIPTSRVPQRLQEEPYVMRKLDDIYHSMSHEETRRLRYMDRPDIEGIEFYDEDEERKLVSVVRNSLEDAGFELLSQRDMDLCDALNAGYLLRLSIVPDVKDLDPDIAQEFYPEWFEASIENNITSTKDLLFDGKVLIYWRGYDTEVTRGRLLLAKLDYVQTKLVQSVALAVRTRLESVERLIVRIARRATRASLAWSVCRTRAVVDAVPLLQALGVRRQLRRWRPSARFKPVVVDDSFFQLTRYGGSKQRILGADPLEPFLIYDSDAEEFCSIHFGDVPVREESSENESTKMLTNANRPANDLNAAIVNITDDMSAMDEEFYECINHSPLRCPYDQEETTLPPMQLLRRVSMNNVVDLFSRQGWRNLFSTLFAKTELVEPTYKEVVVIWRPKRKESKPRLKPPNFVYEVADLFDLEGLEPPKPKPRAKPLPLQIRTFDGTPLANLNAIFPKSKLVFRPADAFVFDLISIVSLGLVVSSQRFDSAKLDFLALVSAIVWLVRLAIRYSNKLARYDLLVKNFLTSKISHRNAGALKYLAAEAGSQRAIRAALVHDWLCQQSHSPRMSDALYVDWILSEGPTEINELVKDKQADVDMQAALNDLEDLNLIKLDLDRNGRWRVVVTCSPSAVESRLRQAWNDIFQGGLSLNFLTGRR